MKILITTLMALLLTACATSEIGRPIDDSAVQSIKSGVTTRGEIVQLFGQPYMTVVDDKGREVLLFMHGTGSYNMFSPSSNQSGGSSLSITINADGTVESFAESSVTTPTAQ